MERNNGRGSYENLLFVFYFWLIIPSNFITNEIPSKTLKDS